MQIIVNFAFDSLNYPKRQINDMLYVIGQICTSTTHAFADFFALQASVRSDATDYIVISPAHRSAIQRRFPAVLKRNGLAISNQVLYVIVLM